MPSKELEPSAPAAFQLLPWMHWPRTVQDCCVHWLANVSAACGMGRGHKPQPPLVSTGLALAKQPKLCPFALSN